LASGFAERVREAMKEMASDPYDVDFDRLVSDVALRDPSLYPQSHKQWVAPYIENQNIQVPKTQVIGFSSAEVPVGSIVLYGVATAPTGWILCDGSAVSRSDQSLLFAVIGTTYGAGDGSSTFNVPNLKGRVPVGLDASQTEFDALAETGGAKTHALTTAELASHNHPSQAGSIIQLDAAGGGVVDFSTGLAVSTSNVTGFSGSGNAHNNLQPYIVMNFIIKAV